MDAATARKLLEDVAATATAVAAAQRERLTTPDEIFDELNPIDQHQADVATETYEREQAATILRLAEEQLADVAWALDRIATGTYGRCETCRALIGDERLQARPEARFCEYHQRDWELSRLLVRTGPIEGAPQDVAEPGWRELGSLPNDDDLVVTPSLSAEERALHIEGTGERLPDDAIEAAEASAGADAAAATAASASADAEDRAELDTVVREQDSLRG